MASPTTISALAIASSSPQAVKVWSKLLFSQVMHATQFFNFMGTGPESMIQKVEDLSRGAGDLVHIDLLRQIDYGQFGVSGDNELLGSEHNLIYRQLDVPINQKRFASGWLRMSQQRTLHQLREDSMVILRDAWARVLDQFLMLQLAGPVVSNPAELYDATAMSVVNAITAMWGTAHNPTVDSAYRISSNGVLTPDLVTQARWKARDLTPPLRPLRIDGQDYYVMFVSPAQAKSLQQSDDWENAQRNAALRGSQNPIFTGALGAYNGVLIYDSKYLPTIISTGPTTNASVAATQGIAVLAGQQAAVLAFGNAFSSLDEEGRPQEGIFSWAEEVEDYGNKRGIAAGAIFGLKRAGFASAGGADSAQHYEPVVRVKTVGDSI